MASADGKLYPNSGIGFLIFLLLQIEAAQVLVRRTPPFLCGLSTLAGAPSKNWVGTMPNVIERLRSLSAPHQDAPTGTARSPASRST